MKKKCLYQFYLLFLLVCFTANSVFSQDEFQRIESNITSYLKNDIPVSNLKEEVGIQVQTLQTNGSWLTIDYLSKTETGWPPLLHLNRIKQFALQIALSKNAKTDHKQLVDQTISALRYWLKVNPTSNNWFQNDIAVPTAIGEILLLSKSDNILPISLQDSLLQSTKHGNVQKAIGANKLDIAIHMLYRACITKDKDLMELAINQAFMPITLENKEGLQPDYSYRQHGPQLQIASYGQVFLLGEYKVASWLIGTKYALPEDKLKILDQYFINTYLKTIRGRYIDFNTEGRGISRNDILDKLSITNKLSNNGLLSLAKKVNPANAVVLSAAEQRIMQLQPPSFSVKPMHSHFYKSDYTLHNRPAYNFNVRTVSKRTIRTEFGNKENLLGKFLPDGSTNIQRSGDEYYNIMPIWEWDKIPGITARDYELDQKTTVEWGESGAGDFTGGVSDGVYGTTVYTLHYNDVTAKKAWFFFDDEVVCLGAGINSNAKEPIITTVNQAWQKNNIMVFANNKLSVVDKEFESNKMQWVWQDSIGYYFPNKGKIKVSGQTQTGSWANVNANRSTNKVEGKVFKLWIDHSFHPTDQTYAYIVKPGVSLAEMKRTNISSIKIVANTSKIQAVKNLDLNMLQIVFHEAGSLKNKGYTISVDQPCLVLIKNVNTSNPEFSISDPKQEITDLNLSYSSTLRKKTSSKSISLPQGDHKGATVSILLNEF